MNSAKQSPKNLLRLGVNIDHVATIRNARGVSYPDPAAAARLAEEAGADGITAHLREDRRHIIEEDVEAIKRSVEVPLNLEIAATAEMEKIALKQKPNAVCLVPENRLELTTEGGLDVIKNKKFLKSYIDSLRAEIPKVSLFLAPDKLQIEAAVEVGATTIEMHTGEYCELDILFDTKKRDLEFDNLVRMAKFAKSLGLEVHAGHGLTISNVAAISTIKEVEELNIGHAIIADSIFLGLSEAVKAFKKRMAFGRESITEMQT